MNVDSKFINLAHRNSRLFRVPGSSPGTEGGRTPLRQAGTPSNDPRNITVMGNNVSAGFNNTFGAGEDLDQSGAAAGQPGNVPGAQLQREGVLDMLLELIRGGHVDDAVRQRVLDLSEHASDGTHETCEDNASEGEHGVVPMASLHDDHNDDEVCSIEVGSNLDEQAREIENLKRQLRLAQVKIDASSAELKLAKAKLDASRESFGICAVKPDVQNKVVSIYMQLATHLERLAKISSVGDAAGDSSEIYLATKAKMRESEFLTALVQNVLKENGYPSGSKHFDKKSVKEMLNRPTLLPLKKKEDYKVSVQAFEEMQRVVRTILLNHAVRLPMITVLWDIIVSSSGPIMPVAGQNVPWPFHLLVGDAAESEASQRFTGIRESLCDIFECLESNEYLQKQFMAESVMLGSDLVTSLAPEFIAKLQRNELRYDGNTLGKSYKDIGSAYPGLQLLWEIQCIMLESLRKTMGVMKMAAGNLRELVDPKTTDLSPCLVLVHDLLLMLRLLKVEVSWADFLKLHARLLVVVNRFGMSDAQVVEPLKGVKSFTALADLAGENGRQITQSNVTPVFDVLAKTIRDLVHVLDEHLDSSYSMKFHLKDLPGTRSEIEGARAANAVEVEAAVRSGGDSRALSLKAEVVRALGYSDSPAELLVALRAQLHESASGESDEGSGNHQQSDPTAPPPPAPVKKLTKAERKRLKKHRREKRVDKNDGSGTNAQGMAADTVTLPPPGTSWAEMTVAQIGAATGKSLPIVKEVSFSGWQGGGKRCIATHYSREDQTKTRCRGTPNTPVHGKADWSADLIALINGKSHPLFCGRCFSYVMRHNRVFAVVSQRPLNPMEFNGIPGLNPADALPIDLISRVHKLWESEANAAKAASARAGEESKVQPIDVAEGATSGSEWGQSSAPTNVPAPPVPPPAASAPPPQAQSMSAPNSGSWMQVPPGFSMDTMPPTNLPHPNTNGLAVPTGMWPAQLPTQGKPYSHVRQFAPPVAAQSAQTQPQMLRANMAQLSMPQQMQQMNNVYLANLQQQQQQQQLLNQYQHNLQMPQQFQQAPPSNPNFRPAGDAFRRI